MSYIGISILFWISSDLSPQIAYSITKKGSKPEAVAKLHFSETEIAAYCVCSTKLLVGEMDERDLKTLEAGKVGNVLMSLAPALKRIRYGCARKVWDARRKQ